MAARLSRPQREKIKNMHEAGMRQKAIAADLGIARCTVARYVQGIESEVQVQRAPAATLTEREVARLRFLAGTVHELSCPSCSAGFMAKVEVVQGECPHCGAGWALRGTEPAAPPRSPVSRGRRRGW